MIRYIEGIKELNWDLLVDLYNETDGVIGLGKRKDLPKIRRAFEKSYKTITAWDGKRIIGAARMISDGECYGWVHDLVVREDFRREGIGKKIMEKLLEDDKDLLIGLTSSFMAIDFYKDLGFKKHKTGMAIYPGRSIYLEE